LKEFDFKPNYREEIQMASGYSPKLPISRDLDDGYALTKSLEQVASQNLKHLLLTSPGERMMDPDFGVGLKRYLFEMRTEEVNYEINSKIREQVSKYLSYIVIQNINFENDSNNANLVNIMIIYNILPSTRSIITEFRVSL
jgi:phage baseplate assembly protein W